MKKRGEKVGEIWPFFGKKSGKTKKNISIEKYFSKFLGMENFTAEISFQHRIWECVAQFN